MFEVIDARTHEVLPGPPTPLLISEGGGLAYFVPNDTDDEAFRQRVPGIWYRHVEATGHVSKDGQYTRVTIRHTDS